jgi:hypothetical protein
MSIMINDSSALSGEERGAVVRVDREGHQLEGQRRDRRADRVQDAEEVHLGFTECVSKSGMKLFT